MEPTAENIIMTPISAHTLQAKAMVLDKNRLIDIVVPKQSRKTAYLSVDGGKASSLEIPWRSAVPAAACAW